MEGNQEQTELGQINENISKYQDEVELDCTPLNLMQQEDSFDAIQAARFRSKNSSRVNSDEQSVSEYTQFRPNMLNSELATESVLNSVVMQGQRREVPIKVIARVRPIIPSERGHPISLEVIDEIGELGHKQKIVLHQGVENGGSPDPELQKIFSFEKVLDQNASQSDVFKQCDGKMLCNAFINGQNSAIFVYGPTSTGKTYSMQGNAENIIQKRTNLDLTQQVAGITNSFEASEDLQNSSNVIQNPFTHNSKSISTEIQKRNTMKEKRSNQWASPQSQNVSLEILDQINTSLMQETSQKGIIQRVLDQVYSSFYQAQLEQSCELRISFLEVYNDIVTDLLEEDISITKENAQKKSQNNSGFQQTSFNISPDKERKRSNSNIGEDFFQFIPIEEEQKQNRIGILTTFTRGKAKTFYQDQYVSSTFNKQENVAGQQKNKGSFMPLLSAKTKQYIVKENADKGVYVSNLSEIYCPTLESAYQCLLKGLMKKKVSQTNRNTSSSRSHTIFQIKMYMKAVVQHELLHPKYYTKEKHHSKVVSKFSLIDLAGSERLSDKEKNQERLEEAKFINKSLSALGNVVAALRTQHSKSQYQGFGNFQARRTSTKQNSRSSFQSPAGQSISNQPAQLKRFSFVSKEGFQRSQTQKQTYIPYRDSKLTHILKDSLGNNSFTHLIITLSPSYLCLPETFSTLAFTKNAKAVKQNLVENIAFKQDLAFRKKVQVETNLMKKNSFENQCFLRQNTFLNQMGTLNPGPDEDEAFVSELLNELVGGNQRQNIEKKNFQELKQIMMEHFRNIRKDHHDLTQKFEEMKQALSKNLEKNEKNILENQRSSSSSGQYGQEMEGRKSGKSGHKVKFLHSLKSISEEDAQQTLQSPYTERKLNRKLSAKQLFTFKQQSSTQSVTKSADKNYIRNLAIKDLNQTLPETLEEPQTFFKTLQKLFWSENSGKLLDTEPTEINDESKPCYQYQNDKSQSQNDRYTQVIPQSNLAVLRRPLMSKSIDLVIASHIKAIRELIQQYKHKKLTKKGKRKSKRLSFFDQLPNYPYGLQQQSIMNQRPLSYDYYQSGTLTPKDLKIRGPRNEEQNKKNCSPPFVSSNENSLDKKRHGKIYESDSDTQNKFDYNLGLKLAEEKKRIASKKHKKKQNLDLNSDQELKINLFDSRLSDSISQGQSLVQCQSKNTSSISPSSSLLIQRRGFELQIKTANQQMRQGSTTKTNYNPPRSL